MIINQDDQLESDEAWMTPRINTGKVGKINYANSEEGTLYPTN